MKFNININNLKISVWLILFFAIASTLQVHSKEQSNLKEQTQIKNWFKEAYKTYPNLPEGILEGISYNTTRVNHLTPNTSIPNCSGTPYLFGIMALIEDGKDIFRNTLTEVSEISGFSTTELKESPRKNILGSAAWLSSRGDKSKAAKNDLAVWANIIADFTGIPDEELEVTKFLKKNFAYQTFKMMKKGIKIKDFQFLEANQKVVPLSYFDDKTIDIFKKKKVQIDMDDHSFKTYEDNEPSNKKLSSDYAGADWEPTNCYSSRFGTPVTDITIHTMEGYFNFAVYTMFKDCNYSVSAHYCVNSEDGYIVQMVSEADKAWHLGPGNPYSVGIEHEGFSGEDGWYSETVYQATADLVKDIAERNNIDPTSCYNGESNAQWQTDPISTTYKIKGHTHYPHSINTGFHWDPGPFWDWGYFYNLINPTNSSSTNVAPLGSLYKVTSEHSTYFGALKAFDGNVNTRWNSNGTRATDYLVIKLDQTYNIDKFIVKHASNNGLSENANTKKYHIAYWDSGARTWVRAVNSYSNADKAAVTTHNVNVTARYVYIYAVEPNFISGDSYTRIPEFEVYGTPLNARLADESEPTAILDNKIELNLAPNLISKHTKHLAFELNTTVDAALAIYNSNGKLVFSLEPQSFYLGRNEITTNNIFNSGIYFLQLKTNNGMIQNRKIVVSN